jgi:hypothetical protein
MSRSYRKRIPILSLSAKNKKKWKRISHKTIRSRVRDAINKGEYELLYDETVGKSFPYDFHNLDFDVYFMRTEFEKDDGFTEVEIKKMFSK